MQFVLASQGDLTYCECLSKYINRIESLRYRDSVSFQCRYECRFLRQSSPDGTTTLTKEDRRYSSVRVSDTDTRIKGIDEPSDLDADFGLKEVDSICKNSKCVFNFRAVGFEDAAPVLVFRIATEA